MADYEINEFGEISFNNGDIKREYDPLWQEYAQLEYEVLNNHHNPTKDPIKIARYNELKKILNIKKSEDALKQAKEKIKQRLIDKSSDKAGVFAAMSQFEKK